MRLIDADALLKHKSDHETISTHLIWNAPTVDAVPVRHGHWIDEGLYNDDFPYHAWKCSECGEYIIEIDVPWYKFCPECGAKMERKEK